MSAGNLGSGEVGAIYNVSMMTHIDELKREKHMQMGILEFMEAIG